MKIMFRDVGRDKASWAAEIKKETFEDDEQFYEWLTREVRQHGIRSHDIDYVLNEDETQGKLYAGFRCIGEFALAGKGCSNE